LSNFSVVNLDGINLKLTEVLVMLDKMPAEDDSVEQLVSNLHDLVAQRQIILDELITLATMTDRVYLEQQWQLTQTYLNGLKKAMLHRRDLLVLGQKNRRQINVYKNIDSDR
jgi:hypothetical protein